MQKLIVLLGIFTSLGFAAASPSPLINNVPNRTTISLDGPWQAIVDPYETGLNARLPECQSPGQTRIGRIRFRQVRRPESSRRLEPAEKELFFYEGPVWYKKSFSYHKREHTRVFMYTGAADFFPPASISMGRRWENTKAGLLPSIFEVTDQIREGDNFIVAEVNNARRRDGVPSVNTDWWKHGGLTRNVMLVEEPETFIQDYVVQLARGSADQIAGWVQLSGPALAQQVAIEIPEAGIKQTVATDAVGRAEFRFRPP